MLILTEPSRTIHVTPQEGKFERALLQAGAGDTIVLESGTYKLTRSILLDKRNEPHRPIKILGNSKQVILDGSELPRSQSPGIPSDIFTVTGSGYELKNLVLSDAGRIAVNLWGGSHVKVEDCKILNSFRGATFMGNGAHHLIVKNCEIFNNCRINERGDIPGSVGWPSAINLGDDSQAVGNKVYANWGEGIGFYGYRPYVADNEVFDNYSVGIYACNAEGGAIERNFVHNTRDARFFRDLYGVNGPAFGICISNESRKLPLTKGFRIQNNVVVGGIFSLFVWKMLDVGGLDSVVIANNTFVGGESATVRIESGIHIGSQIINNVFANPGGTVLPDWNLPKDMSGVTWQANAYWGQQVSGRALEPLSVQSDPKLISVTGQSALSFSPLRSSPLIGRGIAANSASDDYLRKPRGRNGKVTIGAFEDFRENH